MSINSKCLVFKYFRHYSSSIFCKNKRQLNKVYASNNLQLSRQADYLKDQVASVLVERLAFIKQKFPNIVDYLSGPGYLAKHLFDTNLGVEKVIQLDSCQQLLWRDLNLQQQDSIIRNVLENDEILPFEHNTQPIIISNLGLHWTNDLIGVFKQINSVLKADGVFLASMFGGDTLFELRTSMQQAELERTGGVTPRVSPFAKSNDIANLLQRTGFSLITVDTDDITVGYPSMFELIQDLKLMGESNALKTETRTLTKELLTASAAIYQEIYPAKNEDNVKIGVNATFEIIYMIGWKPGPGQQKPLERGSAKKSLKEVFETQKE